jgi:N-acyl homoserine lactone hydrolase
VTLKITPLCVGSIVGMPQPAITYMSGWGRQHTSAMIMFLIAGGEAPIIVDTGTLDPEWTKKYHHYDLVRDPEQEAGRVLRKAGVDPGDVAVVINTHLHWDHCSNNALFSEANFYIQARELAYAANPLPIHRAAFEKVRGIRPPWLEVWDRIETVDGDGEIVPGVSVVSLPGHTPGSQGVLVDAGDTRYLLAGDCIDTYENWDGNQQTPHIPSGSHTDLFEYYSSFDKIEKLGCEVIPSHDPAVVEHGEFT